jgi:muramoyltetrapeptide carboxypeptidase
MRIPKTLRPDDLVLVVSPAFAPDSKELNAGVEYLRLTGLRVELAANAGKNWGNFSGTDEERRQDLQWALDHPEAKMIICSRGGYGCSRIFRDLDFTGFHRMPKWLAGFSDVTILHSLMQKEGFASIHGPMLVHYSRMLQIPACIRQQDVLLRHLSISYPVGYTGQEMSAAEVKGLLTGGNISLLEYLMPELSPEFFDDRILFLEETDEPYYKIDRLLDRIFRAGLTGGLKAVVLGTFSGCQAQAFPLDTVAMIQEKAPGLPVFHGLPCGHGVPSMPLLMGYPASIVRKEDGKWNFRQPGLPLFQ